ncbi:MAG: hypothetical protein ABIQ02_10115 [Saprospiraceae bacterium]
MKRNISKLLKWGCLLGMFILVSCNKDHRSELFVMNQFVDFDIQPGLNTFDTHFFVITPLASTYSEKLALSGRTQSDVSSIESKDAYLNGMFNDINLRFIRTISIYIFDPFKPDDKIEFFYLVPVPYKNTTSIRLFPGIADISHWVNQEFFGIEVRLNFREVTSSLTPMRLQFDIRALGN